MLEKIAENSQLLSLQHALQQKDSLLIEELWNAPKALIASCAQKATGKNLLILTGASKEEGRLFHDLSFFTQREVIHFPAWETLPSENIAPSPDIVGDRYQVLDTILKQQEPIIILSNLQACLQKLIPKESFATISLIKGENTPFEPLVEKLISFGYTKTAIASDKGEFAIRGGIIDIFPVCSPDPYRIEFFGDDIESIRIYDPIGQKSIMQKESLTLTQAKEFELLKKTKTQHTLLNYLGTNTFVIFDDILALEDRYVSLLQHTSSSNFMPIEEFMEKLAPLQTLYLTDRPIEELSVVKYETNKTVQFELFHRKILAKKWEHPFLTLDEFLMPEEDTLLDSLKNHSNISLHFLCSNELEESNLQKKLLHTNLPKKTHFQIGYLSSGFALSENDFLLFPTTELTKRYKIRRQKQRSTYHTPAYQAFDLKPGDLVVHFNNGIGQYLGIEKRPNHEGTLTEFFLIEYAEHAKLFVPVNQAHLITKYVGSNDEIPKLHTIGSARWKKTKEHTQKAILGYAKDLIRLYAERELKGGFAYPKDTADMLSFEEEFPYIETEDQLEAIKSLKEDMISTKPMDRLICGDVGYGKTEVAFRAAFKAAFEGGKQVAVLVPTTVLAMQHYDNFKERFSNFPLNIAALSRFCSTKNTKQTLKQLEEGSLDIVIGTHRLISSDLKFHDLGLIIIDEEQRFGVRAKEHLKKIKTSVDCLTLSATPIPRTLYMSLIGARDMSVISTPPQDRLPITTVLTESNQKTIRTALLRELSRDGQVYIIHNRVETIEEYTASIRKLVPQAKIAFCHGKMHADQNDAVFHAFRKGEIDILIATTIVESGLDISNANTIIIDRADRFGLSDLYQLRGRVGRWNRRAYAYFLVPKTETLSEISRKRLGVLLESSGYGGGMKIAMRDLEIRGSGDILGTEQSGYVATIGFHLYCKLLKKTILALQSKGPNILHEVKIEFPAIDARLSEKYINEVSLRMEIYQRLGEASTFDEIDSIWGEIKDRFGHPPSQALWLYHITRVRIFAQNCGITLLRLQKKVLVIEKGAEKRTSIFQIPKTPEQFEISILKRLQDLHNGENIIYA